MPRPEPLAGLGVLVTRPAGQAAALCAQLEALGAHPIHYPLLTIEPPSDPQGRDQRLRALAGYRWLVFVSPNAARLCAERLDELGLPLPATCRIACVGKGSERAVQSAFGRGADLVPSLGFDSEGLLATPEFHTVQGTRVLILRGEGGRELLAETLRIRGAEVEYVELYRRTPPPPPNTATVARWQGANGVDIISLTSGEALHNLIALLPHSAQGWLRATPLLLFSPRTRDEALRLGFTAPLLLVEEASDAGVVDRLCAWRGEMEDARTDTHA